MPPETPRKPGVLTKLPLLPALIGPDGPFNPSTSLEAHLTGDEYGNTVIELFVDSVPVTAPLSIPAGGGTIRPGELDERLGAIEADLSRLAKLADQAEKFLHNPIGAYKAARLGKLKDPSEPAT